MPDDDFEPLLSASWESVNKQLVDRILSSEEADSLTPSPQHFPAVKQLLEVEAKPVPVTSVLVLVGLFCWLVMTDTSKAAVPCGGVRYWLLVLSIVPIVAVTMLVVRRQLINKGNLKLEVSTRGSLLPTSCGPPVKLFFPLVVEGASCHMCLQAQGVCRWVSCQRPATSDGRHSRRGPTLRHALVLASLLVCSVSAAALSRALSCCTWGCCRRSQQPRVPR